MASVHRLTTCLLLATCLAAAASFRLKRQAQPQGFNCPQTNGTFSFRDDCSKFFQCTNDLATLMDCSRGLLFNSRTGLCTWPNVVLQNPGDCTPPAIQDNEHNMCSQQPAISDLLPGQAWYVAHPTVCNAFYTCGTGYLYAPCTMCPELMYYDSILMACQPMYDNPPENFCNGRDYIAHEDKELARLSGVCWPFADRPNPMQAAYDKISAETSGGGGWRPNTNTNPNNNWNTRNVNFDNRGFLNDNLDETDYERGFRHGRQGSFLPYGKAARF